MYEPLFFLTRVSRHLQTKGFMQMMRFHLTSFLVSCFFISFNLQPYGASAKLSGFLSNSGQRLSELQWLGSGGGLAFFFSSCAYSSWLLCAFFAWRWFTRRFKTARSEPNMFPLFERQFLQVWVVSGSNPRQKTHSGSHTKVWQSETLSWNKSKFQPSKINWQSRAMVEQWSSKVEQSRAKSSKSRAKVEQSRAKSSNITHIEKTHVDATFKLY